MRFYKYQALGNDMIVVDPAAFDRLLTPELVRRLCHRHLGPGADGICYGPLPHGDHPRHLRFFNPDGGEAEKSGNGLRVFARYLWDAGYVTGREYDIWMNGEPIQVRVEEETATLITTTIGRLSFASQDIPVTGPPRLIVEEEMVIAGTAYQVTAVTAGNPHCVIFGDDPSPALAQSAGPAIENASFFPNRANVQFARVLDQHTLQIEIWERGAGYTLASGTSASAAAGAAVRTGRCQSPVEVHMAGGVAQVAIDPEWHATLTGRVQAVYQGILAADFWPLEEECE
ncbi:MAG: diaminopimelate epimerase [Chloroflexi bacterium]|nr:diaminopimelate epimerase [Chloroflexota bacterium]MCI0576722.1 diaminopimelate epimerase [Chloroflexota bacterium]MCI0645534.1 diaminopimelate epimerase [Chloroflexota bacterium]MCI0728893.1 diaminopimelate epimerase [Chloroflexota bacterium]